MGFKKCPLSEQNFCTTDEFRLRIRWRDTLVHFYLSSNFHTFRVSARADFFSKCSIWKEARICCCNTKLVNSPHLWMCLIPNTHKRTVLFLEETWTKPKRSCYLVFTHAVVDFICFSSTHPAASSLACVDLDSFLSSFLRDVEARPALIVHAVPQSAMLTSAGENRK